MPPGAAFCPVFGGAFTVLPEKLGELGVADTYESRLRMRRWCGIRPLAAGSVARALTDFGADRSGLVHDVVASGILLRLVETGSNETQELAEAFYLLAVLSSRIARGYGLSAADFFLERAIRLAPGAPFASEAYALLEQEELLSYEGVDAELPPEERRRLAELRELVDGASP